MSLLQSLTRILAFIGKELVELIRRPGAAVSLIVGPVLIMVLFGLGYDGSRLALRAILVVPPTSGLPADAAAYEDVTARAGRLVAVMTDADAARAALEAGDADVVILAPSDLQADLDAGRQSVIQVQYDLLSPVRAEYASLLADQLADRVNQVIVERVAERAKSEAGPAGERLDPRLIAAPTRAEAQNLAPTSPGITGFYGPAVLALILQHAAVSLTALSLVRERRTGIFDLFRVSATNAAEIVLGKALAFGGVGALVAVAVIALLVGPLDVPDLADRGRLALAVGLLLAASMGLGMLISVVSDSERQAVQLSLLLLLASVFLSGLVLDLGLFLPTVQAVGSLLPVTHGIALFQGLFLRGDLPSAWHLWALVVIAVVAFVLAWLQLRRGMAAARPR